MPFRPTEKKNKEREEAELKEMRRELEEKMLAGLEIVGLPPTTQRKQALEPSEPRLDTGDQKRLIEALLFASARPLKVAEICRIAKELGSHEIERLIRQLKEEYEQASRGFQIREIAGGYEMATDPKFSPWVQKLEKEKRARQATQSALETLAILAYRQPITRLEIEDLRGVDVSGVLGTLLEKGLVRIVGRKEVPGRPYLYGTTDKFLAHFGLKSLSDLPPIGELREFFQKSAEAQGFLKQSEAPASPAGALEVSVASAEKQAADSQADLPGNGSSR
jgi:segregation and condensation protein B